MPAAIVTSVVVVIVCVLKKTLLVCWCTKAPIYIKHMVYIQLLLYEVPAVKYRGVDCSKYS